MGGGGASRKWNHWVTFPTYPQTYQHRCEEGAYQVWLLTPCLFPGELGSMIDSWLTLGNVLLKLFFVVVMYTWSNGEGMLYYLVRTCQDWFMQVWKLVMFLVSLLGFSYHGWLPSRMYLHDQSSIKTLDPETWADFPRQRNFAYISTFPC